MNECESTENSSRAGLDMIQCVQEQGGSGWIVVSVGLVLVAIFVTMYVRRR